MKSTPAVVKARFEAEGLTIAEWATARGYNPRTVYAVLQGRVKAKRGLGHRIAVELGLKAKPQASTLSETFVTVGQVASALRISRTAVRKAVSKGTWHGCQLETRQRHGRGGKSGARFEIRLSSLPAAVCEKVKAQGAGGAIPLFSSSAVL